MKNAIINALLRMLVSPKELLRRREKILAEQIEYTKDHLEELESDARNDQAAAMLRRVKVLAEHRKNDRREDPQ